MANVRTALLLALRPRLYRDYGTLCRKITGRSNHLEVRHELTLLLGEGLVDYWDNSLRRFKLTVAGRNAASRAFDAVQAGRAA